MSVVDLDHSLLYSFILFLSLTHSQTHCVCSPWSQLRWGVCTLRRCWHRAYRSTWCTRASRPSSHTSSRAGCPCSSSSRSDQSWWRWDNAWDLQEKKHKTLSDLHFNNDWMFPLDTRWGQCCLFYHHDNASQEIYLFIAFTTPDSWLKVLHSSEKKEQKKQRTKISI